MIVLTATIGAAALLLIWAGIDHVREPAAFARHWTASVSGHRAGQAAKSVVVLVALAETALAGVVLAALATPLAVGRWALVGQAVIYLGFLGYLTHRFSRGDRSGSCGCTRLASRVGPVSLIRAGLLSLLTAVGAASYPRVALPTVNPIDPYVPVGVVAAVVLTVLCYALPSAIDGFPADAALRRSVMS